MKNDSTHDAPLVTAITIFLNEETFLEEAIQSVLAQTYARWELLLVDDGSSDASPEIARRYAATYPDQVRYLEHPGHQNRGMSATRNLGLRHARGTYIAFLDGDDVWFPEKLEEQVALLEVCPDVGMVCGLTERWYGWTGDADDRERDYFSDVGSQHGVPSPLPMDVPIQPPQLLTRLYPLGQGASPTISSFLVRREVVEAVGGFEAAFRGLYEDQAFTSKVYLHAPVLLARMRSDRYRQHPESCVYTTTQLGKYDAARETFLRWLGRYLNAQGVRDVGVRRAFRRAWWRHRLRSRSLRIARQTLPPSVYRRLQRLRWQHFSTIS